MGRLLCLLALFPTSAFGATGYVVRVDSGLVYLDFNEKNGAAPGRAFEVYTEGAQLKHPVTGKSLGRMENKIAEGTLQEIKEQYSIGKLSAQAPTVKPGMRARLSAPPAQTDGQTPARAPRWKSPVFDYKITGMAVANFAGDGKMTLALADSKKVYLYSYPPQDPKPLAEFAQPGTAPRLLALESADLNGNGKAELFVTLFNEVLGRLETSILELNGNNWEKIAELPWAVRAHQNADGRALLAVQQLVEDPTFPFSAIYPLVFNEGKYAAGKGAIRYKYVDWIYDFTQADFDGTPALLRFTNTHRLKLHFKRGSWATPEAYGQTPSRIRWQGRLLEFHPPVPVGYQDKKRAAVYLVRNNSMLGSLSEPFGLFQNAEVQRKTWNGVSLSNDWKTDLGGYSTALALVPDPAQPHDLAVAVVGSSGQSSLWIYDP
ncbi:MAG: hypothetical protein A3J74_10190 [Elusimicrobia bacterium RIFCSPHIGHO2_02_FULL_57_9]|nr:MAG: hypothetical protein A3J74_10190 [Elusimicrobia bacterium RIFCSPHIGHO2_02_FULL_57_9]